MLRASLTALHDKVFSALKIAGDWLYIHAINIIIIITIAWILRHFSAKLINSILKHTVRSDLFPSKSDREKRYKTLSNMTNAIVRVAIVLLAIVLILGEINPSYANVLFASAGLITVALGFGAKDLINDFIAGIFIISEGQYRVGDWVVIADVAGTVQSISVRTTVLRDLDGNLHFVPNGDIVVATNKTMGISKINELITFDLKADLKLITHVINHTGEELKALPNLKNKIKEAPHVAQVVGYSTSGIVVNVRATTGESDKYEVRSAMYEALHKAFIKNNIKVIQQSINLVQAKK